MTWIESHKETLTHPKFKRLCRRLDVERPVAVGHLHMLWWWCVDYADDGDLSRWEVEDLEDAMDWRGEPGALVAALVETGWLDRDEDGRLSIHDWGEHAGRLVERREANRERMRRARAERAPNVPSTLPASSITRDARAANVQRTCSERAAHADERAAHVRESSGARAALPDHTGPDHTQHDRTGPAPSAPPTRVRARGGRAAAAAAQAPAEELVVPPACERFHAALSGATGYAPNNALFAYALDCQADGVDLVASAIDARSWLDDHPGREASVRFIRGWLGRDRERAKTSPRASPQPIRAAPAVNGARPDKDWTKVARILTPNAVSPPPTETSA